jgi:hypothetical protein
MKRPFLVPIGLALAALSPQAGLGKNSPPSAGTLTAFPAIRTSRTDEGGSRLAHVLLALPRAVRGLASAAGHVSHASHASHVSGASYGHVSHSSHVSHTSHLSSSSTPSIPSTGSSNTNTTTQTTTTTQQPSAILFQATLTVGQETPHPTGTVAGATGHFTATLTGTTLAWTLTSAHLSGTGTAAHIHSGARGQAGPVVVPLCGPCSGLEVGHATLTQAEITDLLAGRAYVNIHTAHNPNGEVRGQITRG